tara:strand:+ start:30689 stop:31096 length:408 start_codon:yes stop_codon:yes gene_type:complete
MGQDDCRFHNPVYPYKVKNICNDLKGKKVEFSNSDDIWDYILLLYSESEERTKNGSSFLPVTDVWDQLPFFVCKNFIYNEKDQTDIKKFLYCSESKTPPYKSLQDTPNLWVDKYFIIKQTVEYIKHKRRENVANG